MNNLVLYSVLKTSKKSKDAGPKAKTDINYFLKEQGYQVIDMDLPVSHFDKVMYRLFKLPKFLKHQKVDNIIFQYPIYSLFLTKQIITRIRKNTRAKLIFMVHDVETLRVYLGDKNFEKGELEIFNAVDALIVHNEAMKDWLQQKGVTTPMIVLGVFDYFNPQPIQPIKEFNQSVCFAGNLQKAEFLTKLNFKNTKMAVYGPNQKEKYPNCIDYQGAYLPDELPKYLNENFGLIWDGDTLDRCSGTFGEYMKYNNPHKTSLYLSSGIPVIIWKKAAMAEFVEKNQVGITVDNLNELDQILENMSEETYLTLKNNAMNLAEKLRNGEYIKNAIKQAITNK